MRSLSIVATGDLILDVPDADHWLAAIAPVLRSADMSIGHLEVPHSTSVTEMAGDIPAPAAPPENVAAIARAGFDAVTLAGNHIADCGEEGIADTCALLEAAGIGFCGAGRDAEAAFAPLIRRVHGRRRKNGARSFRSPRGLTSTHSVIDCGGGTRPHQSRSMLSNDMGNSR